MTSSALPADPGTVLTQRFRLERELGRGAVSRVFRAHDTHLDLPVAVKLVRKAEAAPELAGFRAEVGLGRRVGHPNVVRIHDLHRDPAFGWFVTMELLDGATVRDEAALRRLPPDEVASIGAHVAAGLAALHQAGVAHRDVRVGNVMLGRRAVLFDLGLATPFSAGEVRDRQHVGPEGDLFALGLLLYELATGQRAFANRVHSTPPARPERLPDTRPLAAVPSALQAVIADLLDPVRPARLEDADAFGRRLARLPAGLRGSTPPLQSR